MSKLTPKEYQLVRFVLKGHTNLDIAMEMGISPNTVKTHMSNVFGKMKVRSKNELISDLLG